MLTDKNDYPTSLPRHVVRSALHHAGLSQRLGYRYWRPTATAPYIHVLRRRPVAMFDAIPVDFADPVYGPWIGQDSAKHSLYVETVTAIDDSWVDPNRGHVIGPDGRLVLQSMLQMLYPSAWRYARRGSGTRLSEAIVYDGFASVNYYHHLIDTLPSIALFHDRSGLAPDLPLIVNRWIYDSCFFAYLRQRSAAFAGLNWRVQEPGEWIHVDRAYRLHATPYDRQSLAEVRALYGRVSERAIARSGGRRVFLSRDPAMFGRGIHNEREVAALLGAHGFETVYAEHLSLEEQQRAFEETTHLVALQGMGLVQQMFMDPALGHVIELMPADRLQSEYYWQGWTLGMRYYDVQTGTAMDRTEKYTVDLKRLEAGVRRMLDHPVGQKRYGETLITAD